MAAATRSSCCWRGDRRFRLRSGRSLAPHCYGGSTREIRLRGRPNDAHVHHPKAVCPELVEGLSFLAGRRKERGFDRLSPNGTGVVAVTEFFQNLGMSYEWAWGVATVCGILLIALPLMLAVAMIDRKSVVKGKSVSVRVELGGGRSIKKKR